MYFWKIKKLTNDIKSGKLTEKDRFIYALIYVAFSTGLVLLSIVQYGNVWDIIWNTVDFFIIFLGTIFAYKANGGASGSDFLGKYFSIGFVMSMRFLVLGIIIALLEIIFLSLFFTMKWGIPINNFIYPPCLVLDVCLYWRICVHIKEAALQKT